MKHAEAWAHAHVHLFSTLNPNVKQSQGLSFLLPRLCYPTETQKMKSSRQRIQTWVFLLCTGKPTQFLPFLTPPSRMAIYRSADFLMATNCLSYIFCPIPPLSYCLLSAERAGWIMGHLNLSMPFYILSSQNWEQWPPGRSLAWQIGTFFNQIRMHVSILPWGEISMADYWKIITCQQRFGGMMWRHWPALKLQEYQNHKGADNRC